MKINRNHNLGTDNNRLSFSFLADASDCSAPARDRWMVVDDDADLLGLLRQMLELAVDVEIVTFSNSTEALLAFHADPESYQMVITDYHMPGMDGMELCRRMRMMSPDLAVILSTSDDTVSLENALGRGFRTLLRKPYAFAALSDLLENYRPEAQQTGPYDRASLTPLNTASRTTSVAPQPVPTADWIASF